MKPIKALLVLGYALRASYANVPQPNLQYYILRFFRSLYLLVMAIVGICYKSAFSQHFRHQAAVGGELILTSSNNAHYSRTMPAQHHAHDVMRAIETDRWTVWATNTGLALLLLTAELYGCLKLMPTSYMPIRFIDNKPKPYMCVGEIG